MAQQEQVRRDFQDILHRREDIGVHKIVSGWFFEPRHIFDPGHRRRPKPGIILMGSYLLLMATAGVVFNIG